MAWASALILLLIVLFYGRRYFAGGGVARDAIIGAESPVETSVEARIGPGLEDVDPEDLWPPTDLHASGPWDDYWRRQYETGLWAFNEIFVDDRELLRVIHARGFQVVLCVGSGLSLEPHALEAAGLRVTMLDISRAVVAVMGEATVPPSAFSRILDDSQLSSGGSLECVAGDLTDPAVCPGPFEVIIERRTLQLFPEAEREKALASIAARMTPDGILFTHAHDALGGPGRPTRHPLEPFLERCGFVRCDFETSKSATGRSAITFISTG